MVNGNNGFLLAMLRRNMSPLLIGAIVIITLALVFYSIGVIGEARRKNLLWKDIIWFGLGLVADFIGTMLMRQISMNGDNILAPWANTLMTISGTAAIILMLIHIVFAVLVMFKFPDYRKKFHKWSVVIYAFWLVSYISGPIGLMG